MSAKVVARLAVALFATAAIVVSLQQLEGASEGVRVSRARVGSIPVTAFAPEGGAPGERRPVVVIAHGFAGSQQLMLPQALTLARHGYLALTFDFPGHGRNAVPMAGGIVDFAASTRALLEALGEVAGAARAWPGSDGRLALLGHSMASDIVIRRGMGDAAVQATVALSAYSPTVTATSPRNLLIVDGALEPRMLHDEGLRIVGLAQGGAPALAGRTYGDFATGSARRFALARGVEHISVLYSRDALRESLDWIDRSFGRPARSTSPLLDARGPWLGLLCLGIVALAWPLAALLPRAVRVAPAAASAAMRPGSSSAPEVAAGAAARESAASREVLGRGAGAAVAREASMHEGSLLQRREALLVAQRDGDEALVLPSMSAIDVAEVGARAGAEVGPDPGARAVHAPGSSASVASRGLTGSAAAGLVDNPWRAPGTPPPDVRRLGWRGLWPVAVLPAILTPLLLWKVPGGFLPILLGDYLLLHFALYGLLTFIGLRVSRVPLSPFAGLRPLALAVAALAATVYGVFAIGLPLDRYVTSFAPTGVRAWLVLAVACGALPYFLADEWLVRGASRARGAYAFTKLMFLLSMALAIALNPERLFFLAIVVPAILVAFVIYGLFSRWVFRSIGHPWAGAIANAMAFAWLIAVTFPVVSAAGPAP